MFPSFSDQTGSALSDVAMWWYTRGKRLLFVVSGRGHPWIPNGMSFAIIDDYGSLVTVAGI
ncbi:hypothetical protein [Bordetella genomosp. 11]|uniref:Uncharacterized protein n=1 Tax=Bordetella genomosp. 11 TaxID=1416808 RepID=A0A261UJM8_9BORD|nr:hypothetical protein [Bordetella genomosp. 11]OZI61582.1 hypothetical protein CAL28_20070 [Bordetella genomosp. 11]